jgi:hypothetical protein
MTDDAPSAPAGWYPAPDGGQRYWDGAEWQNLPGPAPQYGSTYSGQESGMRRLPVILAAVALATVGLSGGAFGAWQFVQAARLDATTTEQQTAIDELWVQVDELQP